MVMNFVSKMNLSFESDINKKIYLFFILVDIVYLIEENIALAKSIFKYFIIHDMIQSTFDSL